MGMMQALFDGDEVQDAASLSLLLYIKISSVVSYRSFASSMSGF
jgi:hypothetical protein